MMIIVKMVVYADDICIIIKNQIEFQKVFRIMAIFSKDARISLNSRKSSILCLNDLKLESGEINQVDELKILGITFKTSWDDTISNMYEVQLKKNKTINIRLKV